jgi:raffinose/stachyose/melibiose transport system permease protein
VVTRAAFFAPATVFYTLFMIVPLLGTIFLSVTDWTGFSVQDIHFVGADNYRALLEDPVFHQALGNTLVFVVLAAVFKTVVALVMALLVHMRLPLSNLFRSIFVLPSVISVVVIGIVFSLILSPSLGPLNALLEAVGLGRFQSAWLGDNHIALFILIGLDVWLGFGVYMLLFVSRLVSLPHDLSEAAVVDGATASQELRHVTLPQLSGVIGVVMLLSVIDSLKVFATVYVMTSGGPNHATEVLSTWGYFQAFSQSQVGYGSAVLVVLLFFTFLVTVAWMIWLRPRTDRIS